MLDASSVDSVSIHRFHRSLQPAPPESNNIMRTKARVRQGSEDDNVHRQSGAIASHDHSPEQSRRAHRWPGDGRERRVSLEAGGVRPDSGSLWDLQHRGCRHDLRDQRGERGRRRRAVRVTERDDGLEERAAVRPPNREGEEVEAAVDVRHQAANTRENCGRGNHGQGDQRNLLQLEQVSDESAAASLKIF